MGTYVIIGAAKSGIGEAVTRDLLARGHRLICTSDPSDSEAAQALTRDSSDIEIKLIDHANLEQLRSFVQTCPDSIDGLVIAQMFFDLRTAGDFNLDAWSAGLSINLTMPHYLTVSLAPRILRGGGIVTVTSTEGFIGSFGAAGYAAAKAAIHNLVKTHANNFGAIGVRANAVAAGWIGGVMDTDEVFNMSRRITPLGRLGTPDEIAAVVRFLLGKDASFITGATIVADGGYTCVDAIAKFEYDTMAKS